MDVAQQPVIFGEVLYDVFDDGHAVLGGAPFNVAWHLQGFALAPLFISRIGQDALGEKVISTMQAWGMTDKGLQHDEHHATGTVQVSIKNGQPAFSILENVAYDQLEQAPVQQLVQPQSHPFLYHGSLITRTNKARDVLSLLRKQAQLIFVDINLRAPWWNEAGVFGLIQGATWLKLNDDELAILSHCENRLPALEQAANELLIKYSLQGVIVTRGKDGAFICSKAGFKHAKPAVLDSVEDTVGAGDAFSAVCIMGLLLKWDYQAMLDRAAVFAAAICQQRGATSNNPSLYQDFARQWQLA